MQVRNVIFDIGLHVVGVRAGRRTLPNFLASIDSFLFPIIPSLYPQNFALVIVFRCSWENAVPPGAFKNNGLCKIGGGGQLTECVMGDSKIENRFPTTIAMGLLRERGAVRAEAP